MKKYIMAAAAISLFLGTQITSMDKEPSAEGIRAFERSLSSKLQSERTSYLGNEQFPMLDADVLVQWKKPILDMARRHNINRAVAYDIFLSLVREIIIQVVAARNPDYDMETVENLYGQGYLPDVNHAAYLIFH